MQLETNLLREDFEIETEQTQFRFITKKSLLTKKYLQMHAGVVFFPCTRGFDSVVSK